MIDADADFFTDPDVLQDPRGYFTQMRSKAPAAWEPHQKSLMVTGFTEAMAILRLGEDPGLQEQLRAEPDRIADFLEETLRFDPPVKVVYRLAVVDTEIAGVSAPAGTIVTVCLTGGNNDPRHFEAPDRFDIDRPNVRDHMAFSRGAHFCLGAPLARLEARVAIERLLARVSSIRICEDHHGPPDARRYRYEPTYTFRSLAALHIEFTPS